MSFLVDILSGLMLLAGGVFCIIGATGLVRMPYFYTRMHAASVADTLGSGLILGGLALQAGFSLVFAKLVMIFVLLLLTGPLATHALARAAYHRGLKPLLHREEAAPSPKP